MARKAYKLKMTTAGSSVNVCFDSDEELSFFQQMERDPNHMPPGLVGYSSAGAARPKHW